MKSKAHITKVCQLRLAHARLMSHFDNAQKRKDSDSAQYWLSRAGAIHDLLLTIGESL